MTRRRLLRAGRRAFARRGLAGANLREDILAPARVSVGSFYHQFEDKTELLLEILREQAQAAARVRGELCEAPPPRDFAEVAERGLGALLAVARADPEAWRVLRRERWCHDARVRRFLATERGRWRAWLCEEQRRAPGRSRPRARRERLADYLLGLGCAQSFRQLRHAPRPRLRPAEAVGG